MGQSVGAIEALLGLADQLESWWGAEQDGQHAGARAADDLVGYLMHGTPAVFVAAFGPADAPLYFSTQGRHLSWPAPAGWWLVVHEPWRVQADRTTIEYHLPEGWLAREHGPDDPYRRPIEFRLVQGRADRSMLQVATLLRRKDRRVLNGYSVLTVAIDEHSTRDEIAFALLLGALERGWLDSADQQSLTAAVQQTAGEALRTLRHRPPRRRTRWVEVEAALEDFDQLAQTEAYGDTQVTIALVRERVTSDATNDSGEAVGRLLESLSHRWEWMRGAEDIRRYTRKTARAVGESLVAGEPWKEFGLKKTAYYAALRANGRRSGRYFDPRDPINRKAIEDARSRANERDRDRARNQDVVRGLLDRGFSYEAARKRWWRHRDSPEDLREARPRPERRGVRE